MAIDVISSPITMEQFLELERNAPEDMHYEVIRGELREYSGVTTRNLKHSVTMTRIGQVLWNWLDEHSEVSGIIGGGKARCRLTRNPESIVGLDVAFFEGEQHVNRTGTQTCFDGPPVLAVEVLSGSDTHQGVVERIEEFLQAGVKQVWVADPDLETVTIHRPNAPPRMFSREQELSGEPELPGLTCRVAKMFSRRI